MTPCDWFILECAVGEIVILEIANICFVSFIGGMELHKLSADICIVNLIWKALDMYINLM